MYLAACNPTPTQVTNALASLPQCSSGKDVTTQLNSDIQGLAAGASVTLPAKACYIVSSSPQSLLTLNGKDDLAFYGNGATFKQTSYPCDGSVQPIMTMTDDNNITLTDTTFDGPANCPGAEGDAGVYLGQSAVGNANITFNGDTIENTNGDGMDVYPYLGVGGGVNKNITFENGSMINVSDWAFVPEGVVGLNITGNTFSADNAFMNMEVDANAQAPYPTCGTTLDIGQCDISIANNSFNQGSTFWMVSTSNGTCIPAANLNIENNTLDATTGGLYLDLSGSGSSACGRDSTLDVEGNTSLGAATSSCGGSGIGCSMIQIADWTNISIVDNSLLAQDGENQPSIPCITLQGVASVSIVGNLCNNAYDIWDPYYWQFQETGGYTNSGISECSNTYWVTEPVDGASAQPRDDAACLF